MHSCSGYRVVACLLIVQEAEHTKARERPRCADAARDIELHSDNMVAANKIVVCDNGTGVRPLLASPLPLFRPLVRPPY